MVSKKSNKKNIRKGKVNTIGYKDIGQAESNALANTTDYNKALVQRGYKPRKRAKPKKVKSPTPKKTFRSNKQSNS